MEQPLKDWYTISELADKIQMSRKTVWAWVKNGKLLSVRYGGQHRITEAAWLEFLTACNQKDQQ